MRGRGGLVTLVVATFYLVQYEFVGTVEAKHIPTGLIKEHNMNEVSPHGKAGEEPNLFDLLMSALSDTEMMEAEEEAARRKQLKMATQSNTKPCYWSLVSCYKRRRK